MPSITSSASPRATDEDLPPLLDAAQLSSANPPSFICASCSLSLVQASKIRDYRDLPSEHWAELVEAWMCHSDQKLHDQIVKHGQQGFWPEPGQGLVGGSYILFEESCITVNNLHAAEEKKVSCDTSLNHISIFLRSIYAFGRSRRPALTIHQRTVCLVFPRWLMRASADRIEAREGFMMFVTLCIDNSRSHLGGG